MTRREFLKRLVQGLAVIYLAPRVLEASRKSPHRASAPRAEDTSRYWLEGRAGACATVETPPLWPPDGA